MSRISYGTLKWIIGTLGAILTVNVVGLVTLLLECIDTIAELWDSSHLPDVVELPLKKLLSSFTTTSGCSSGI
jgi:hypothetical protein